MSSAVIIVDTSIFVEILAVPGKSQQHKEVYEELKGWIENSATLLLPVATIIETGNHIAQVAKGHSRRTAAVRYVKLVGDALSGQTPFAPTPSFSLNDLLEWLPNFVDQATAGIGMGDASLIRLWTEQEDLHKNRRVLIWTRDSDLRGYDTGER